MKLKQGIVVFLVIFLLGFGATQLVYAALFKPEVHYFNTEFRVTDERVAGLNADTDAVKFGTISLGNKAIRDIDVSHKKSYPVKVSIAIAGKGTEWITVSQNDFILPPKTLKRLNFYLNVPGDAEVGNYTGVIQFKFRRALFK